MGYMTRFATDILSTNNSAWLYAVKRKTRPMNSQMPTAPKDLSGLVPDQTLDITRDVCPMTFVRTRLALDRLESGRILLVLLRGEEPRRNVPRSAAELGHTVLAENTGADGVTKLLLRRGQ